MGSCSTSFETWGDNYGTGARSTSLETSSTMMLEVFRMGKKPKSFLVRDRVRVRVRVRARHG